ncbi:MFS transporter [Metarhizium guizhouense ARSEF 977]|uniref:MFS transporter n=1 Tax=Metarhizium guizhouense (strain ARSEF 977) TaxID=1276136 RepID=A0A0B4H7R3_METGA|nr:MFS transporter [Metarhizium guizhouense ARSEF 977]
MDSSERSPLLSPVKSHQDEPRQIKREKAHPAVIVLLLLLYTIFLDLGFYLMDPAQTRILERIYCREYYEKHDPSLIGSDGRGGVGEKWCKVSWVQGEVAMLKGWQLTFESTGMLIFSIPWGYAADVYGRKPVIMLVSVALLVKHSYVQLVSYLGGAIPLQWIWLSALHAIFGGGVPVATALTHTIVSDVVAERSRVTIFFQLMAVSIAAEFLGSLGAAALMVWNPWIPMILAIFIKATGIGVLLFIPETLNYNATESDAAPTEEATAQPSEWWRCCQRALSHIMSSISFLASNKKLLLIISPFTVHPLFNQEILRLYISTHYKQTLAYATMVISIRSGCILFLNLFILPVLNRYYQKLWGPRQSDLLLARASAAIMSLTPSPPINRSWSRLCLSIPLDGECSLSSEAWRRV